MTTEELERAFHTYFEEIDRCVRAECYWALLHMLVIFPDICAALEADDGQAGKGGRYRNWCKRYFTGDKLFSPRDRYAIRCSLLHEGRTLTRGGYRTYSFVQPTETGNVFHRIITEFGGGKKPNFTLDVSKMAEETTQATRRWFADLQQPRNASRLKNVERHLPLLAKRGPKDIPGIGTISVQTVSSTGSETFL